jgi:hypothetical protein
MRMPRLNHVIVALRRRSLREEGGFTVTELAAAFAILLLALTALARTATVAFSDVSNARQRQSGNQLANQLLEEVRGLPFDTVKKGLSSSDLSGDSNILSCAGGIYRYRSCTGEPIVHTPGLANTSPLVPHRGSFGPPDYPSTYAYRTYVTQAAGAPSSGAYRVTVIVDWSGAARPGATSQIELQTLVYSPQGCVDTASHPFGAPCQPYYYGTGTAGGGSFLVSGPFGDDVGGADYESLSGSLVAESADAQVEQVSLIQGNVTLPEISQIVDGVQTTVSSAGAFSSADSDPATPSGAYDSQSVGPQSPGTIRIQDGPDRMDLTLSGNAQANTISTTAAGGGNACNLQVDGRPCGFASATQSGGMSLVADLQDGGLATLISVGTSSTQVTDYVRREVPVAGQNGLLREQITWNVPEIRLGGLPSDVNPPTGWQGYWVRLRDFSATATASAGTSTTAPSVSINGGTIDAWRGNNYDAVPVTAAGGTVAINSTVQQTTVHGDQLRVEMSGEVTMDPSTTRQTITTGSTRTEAEAVIGSPMIVEMRYLFTADGETVMDLTISFTAGSSRATVTYRPTPAG